MGKIVLQYVPTEKQKAAHGCRARNLLFGGAKGGGKTIFLVHELFLLAHDYPGNVLVLARKIGTHLTATTLRAWRQFIPKECYKINEQKREIVVFTGREPSVIYFGGFDNSEDCQRFAGMSIGGGAIDEAHECSEDDFRLVAGGLRLTLPDGKHPCYRMILTANPRPGWLKNRFILNASKDNAFIAALPGENPHNPSDYVDQLKETYKDRPELLQALVMGSWEDYEGGRIIIGAKFIDMAINRVVGNPYEVRKVVAVDVARYGDDESVIYGFEEGRITASDIYAGKSLFETAGRAVGLAQRIGANTVVVDVIGMGAGVSEKIKEIDSRLRVIECSSSSKSSDNKYFNLRAEMWFNASEMFQQGKVCIPKDNVLISDLGVSEYMYAKNGKMIVEGKDEIKKRIGKSPDRGDACVMGLWALGQSTGMDGIMAGKQTTTQKWIERKQRELSGVGFSYMDMES